MKSFTLWSGPTNPAAIELFPPGIPFFLPADCRMIDGLRLVRADIIHLTHSVKYARACPIATYDDGYGPLFILRDSTGIQGIARASTWGDAWSIAEDEFFPEADETVEELRAEYNKIRETVKIIHVPGEPAERECTPTDYETNGGKLPVGWFVRWETRETDPPDGEEVWMENELFCEAYGFRPNGANATDVHKHGIYWKDLNGEHLDTLTPELMGKLDIVLTVETE